MKARFQAYLSQLFRRPMVEKFQTPRIRRGLAVALMLVQLSAAGCLLMIPHDIIWPMFPVFFVMVYLQGMLNMATRGMFELWDEHLDEFLVAERDAAYRKAYYFGLLWLLLVPLVDGLTDHLELRRIFTLGFIMLGFLWGLSLPAVIAAWSRPAETVEE
ncbi:MAG: hypothetical protein AAGM16_08005 [Pseudomonadota bacterium]